uniref:U3 small nucleolar RNA-associated protein 20 C-terminal domain-containing protein n=1 Tax=Eucampia antarctica TaxID=49252 RepID=A0A7S2WCB5_9STRA
MDIEDPRNVTLSDSLVPLLTTCVRHCTDNVVITFSLKCLIILLRMDLPSVPQYSKKLGGHCLRLLTLTGATSKTQSEMIQICFKMLTLLMAFSKRKTLTSPSSTPVLSETLNTYDREQSTAAHIKETEHNPLPLGDQQMQVLVSFLQTAVTDYEHHHATFGLIKSITSTNCISPQFYDLMEILLKLTVQSQKVNIREQSRIVFMQYLIEYPMGQHKLESHLKQIVLNLNYEYEDGRISAIKLLEIVIGKIPIPLLQEHTQLFFLPLVLQLVNDQSKQCRESVADCILLLLKRLPSDSLQSLYGYVIRWAKQDGAESQKLRRTSAQLFGIFLDAREDFFKKGNISVEMIQIVCVFLVDELGTGDCTDILLGRDWEVCYFCLICAEKINTKLPSITCSNMQLWKLLLKCLAHPHPWIQRVSSRIINSHISQLDLQNLTKRGQKQSFITLVPGSLFQIARNLCYQLNTDEKQQNESINVLAIKSLTWVLKAMDKFPNLCFEEGADDTFVDSAGVHEEQKDPLPIKKPVLWLMMRLSNIAKSHGTKRREAIFKCFAAFVTTCDISIIIPHIELIVEPLQREISEDSSKTSSFSQPSSFDTNQVVTNKVDLAQEVLQLIEDKCGTEQFQKVCVAVKKKAREKRDKRKQEITSEAIHDPVAYAKRKVLKNQKKRFTQKRKIEERRKSRGASEKKSRYVE